MTEVCKRPGHGPRMRRDASLFCGVAGYDTGITLEFHMPVTPMSNRLSQSFPSLISYLKHLPLLIRH